MSTIVFALGILRKVSFHISNPYCKISIFRNALYMMQNQKYEISAEIKYLVETKMSITKIHKITINNTGDFGIIYTPLAKLSVRFIGG
jgi:hypothetical protein